MMLDSNKRISVLQTEAYPLGQSCDFISDLSDFLWQNRYESGEPGARTLTTFYMGLFSKQLRQTVSTTALHFCHIYPGYLWQVARIKGLEPITSGFGIRRSTNWAKHAYVPMVGLEPTESSDPKSDDFTNLPTRE